MTFGSYDTALLAVLSTAVVGLASGIVPIVNAELYVLFLGAAAPRPLLPVLLVVVTLAHMGGKSVAYWAGRNFERLPGGRLRRWIAAGRSRFGERRTLGGALLFTSALTGLPPFYALAVGAGVVRYSYPAFLAVGTAGRLLRFGALLFAPAVARVLTA